jgi:hypothetical protein
MLPEARLAAPPSDERARSSVSEAKRSDERVLASRTGDDEPRVCGDCGRRCHIARVTEVGADEAVSAELLPPATVGAQRQQKRLAVAVRKNPGLTNPPTTTLSPPRATTNIGTSTGARSYFRQPSPPPNDPRTLPSGLKRATTRLVVKSERKRLAATTKSPFAASAATGLDSSSSEEATCTDARPFVPNDVTGTPRLVKASTTSRRSPRWPTRSTKPVGW